MDEWVVWFYVEPIRDRGSGLEPEQGQGRMGYVPIFRS